MISLLTALLLLAPLAGSILNGLKWKTGSLKTSSFIACTACFISFISSILLFFQLNYSTPEVKFFNVSFIDWISIGEFNISFSFLIDSLSCLMLLVITGVGFLIHLFSIYYMSEDKGPAKYFSYLNLFIFSMITLVLANNLFLMFLGWEGVGLCSYLLIGFWFTDSQKAAAGMKAFIVNRIGDIGLLLGMFFLFFYFNSLNFKELESLVRSLPEGSSLIINLVCLCLFLGAVGKSAQIPLYIWLPSAMAGPTPVSALIHAATMVTAGVYLILRMNFLFISAPEILNLICWTGLFTALLTAVIACFQTDIKKVLAYSTVSQLGYMFIAMGLKAFSAGLFHLITHAFFKALLFLAAGAVIHGLKGEQNIYFMGNLRKKLPLTYFSFLIGFLALIGLPPLSGFFSKDEILWSAWAGGRYSVFAIGLFTALLTAFYMTRLFTLVFHWKNNLKPGTVPHEGGFFNSFPLLVLSFLSIIAGLLGLPHIMDNITKGHWLKNQLADLIQQPKFKGSVTEEIILMSGTSLFIIFTVLVTVRLYSKHSDKLSLLKQNQKKTFNFFNSALKVDEFIHQRLALPCLQISRELWTAVDQKTFQGFIFLIQRWLKQLRDVFLLLQNGKWQNYLFFMTFAVVVCIVFAFMG